MKQARTHRATPMHAGKDGHKDSILEHLPRMRLGLGALAGQTDTIMHQRSHAGAPVLAI